MQPSPPSAVPAIRELRREVASASDGQVLRILATVESIPERGRADELIAPVRDRLMVLRPPRRLRFSRLLFHPLDTLIVPPGIWRPGQQALPRSMVPPFSEIIRVAMGPGAALANARIAGRTTADIDLIYDLGKTVWLAAARILAEAERPVTWCDTGLGNTQFKDLALSAAMLLSQATALDALCIACLDGLIPPPPDAIHAIMQGALAIHEPALPMLLRLMLARLPEAAPVLAHAYPGGKAAVVQAALDDAADQLLNTMHDDGPGPWIAGATLIEAGARVRRTVTLLGHLEALKGPPARRERCRRFRLRLDAACKFRFETTLQQDVLQPLLEANAHGAPGLESAARGLRVLESEARGLGDGRHYDALLANTADVIKSAAIAGRLSLAERARLVEIVAGPDVAFTFLQQGI